MFNKIIIEGRITHVPSITKSANGMDVANFNIANNTRYKEAERTAYIDCVAFGSMVPVIKDRCTVGRLVLLSGRYFYNRYEKKDGTAGTKTGMVVETIDFLDAPKNGTKAPRDEEEPKGQPESFKKLGDEPKDIVPEELPF